MRGVESEKQGRGWEDAYVGMGEGGREGRKRGKGGGIGRRKMPCSIERRKASPRARPRPGLVDSIW